MAEKYVVEQCEIEAAYQFVRDSLVRSREYVKRTNKVYGVTKQTEIGIYETLIKRVDEMWENYMSGGNYYG